MLDHIMMRNDIHKSVLVTVRSPIEIFGKTQERDAMGIADWHMPASISPMNYSISLPNWNGVSRMISRSGNFVVNFMGKDHGPEIAALSSQDGSLTDMFLLMGLTKQESQAVESPCVAEAKAWLECEVLNEIESGDHTVFVGRVMQGRDS
jgi:flavin reductase (DIM6/NTAB) family NADH-FMN oxidoreductase RutF